MSQSADDLGKLEADQKKLYDLIWKRTLASQMEAAKFERTTVDVASADAQVNLRATGQVVTFDGFLKVYEEGRDDVVDEDDGARLPQITQGEPANRLIPEDKGRLVIAFLENYFRKYVGYDFTATLEEELDQVSAGDAEWLGVMSRFWKDFSAAIGETADLRITEVLEKINDVDAHLARRRGLHRLRQLS